MQLPVCICLSDIILHLASPCSRPPSLQIASSQLSCTFLLELGSLLTHILKDGGNEFINYSLTISIKHFIDSGALLQPFHGLLVLSRFLLYRQESLLIHFKHDIIAMKDCPLHCCIFCRQQCIRQFESTCL